MNPHKLKSLAPLGQQPIGVFDSGLGGLTVLRELQRSMPNEHFVYLGDTARTPYGPRNKSTIIRYSMECAGFLQGIGAKLVVVACNTASAVALHELDEAFSCPVIGTITPAVTAALAATKHGKIGVIGTQATVGSGVYDQALRAANPEIEVTSVACPLLVPLVENGMYQGEIVDKVIEMYLRSLRDQKIDTLVLGCTHYPILTKAIDAFFAGKVEIIECSKAITVEVQRLLTVAGAERKNGVGQEEYFVTDEVSRFNFLASLILDRSKVEAVHVEDLVGYQPAQPQKSLNLG